MDVRVGAVTGRSVGRANRLAAVFGRILKGRQDDVRRIGHRAH